jgi:hypothetical protein
MVTAYEGALRDLRLINLKDPATIIVAKRIIEVAKLRERVPARLRAAGEMR